jgi:GH25 family lysozyme M1 (1,4-beta-N-acetylmuramidase)
MSDDPRNPQDFETTTSFPLSAIASVRLAIADYCLGLDLSHHRPNLDLRAAKQQKIRFIITKATQGDYRFDEWYEPYRDQSKAKSLPFGAFHYWDAAINPLKQAKYFFDHVGDDPDLLPIWDIEKYGNQGVLPPATAAQQIHDGLQETEQLFGREAMIYTNRDSWQVLTANSPIIAAFPLWVASWTTAASPYLPIGALEWVYWQYTSRFSIPGAPHAGYDANRYNGNEGQFEEYVRSLNGQQPPQEHDHPLLKAEIENLNLIADKHDQDIKVIRERIFDLEQKMTDIGKAAGG